MKFIRLIFLISVFLMIAACGTAPTPVASEEPQANSSLTIPEPTSIPEEVLPPGDAGEMIERAIASGQITREDALVAFMKMLANEESLPPALQGEFLGTDIYEIFLLVNDYIANGADSAVRAELQRLLELTTFTHEQLQEISEPEPEANIGDGTHLASFDSQSGCGASPLCLFYRRVTVNGKNFDIYFPRDPDPVHGRWWAPYLPLVEAAIRRSIERYDTMGTMRDTDIVFFPARSLEDSGWLASVPGGLDPDGPCAMGLYVALTSETDDDILQNSIAHELFHCLQLHNYPDQLGTNGGPGKWWLESTAETYGNLLYPSQRVAWRIRNFDAAVGQGRALTQMPYDGFVFFNYLQAKRGDAGITAFMAAMPTSGDLSMQFKAFHDFSDMPVFFQQFAQDYFLKNVGLPVNPTVVSTSIFGDIVVRIETAPMVMRYGKVNYQSAIGFNNVYGQVGGGLSAAHSTNGWGALPSTIGPECQPREYLVVTTTTLPAPFKTTWNISVNEAAPCPTGCLIGTWRMDAAEYLRPIKELYPPPPAGTGEKITAATGGVEMTFTEDGTFTVVFETYGELLVGIAGIGVNSTGGETGYNIIGSTVSGGGTAPYVIPEPGIVSFDAAGGSFNLSITTLVMDSNHNLIGPPTTFTQGGGGTSLQTTEFSCGENYLLYAPPPVTGQNPYTWQLYRVIP